MTPKRLFIRKRRNADNKADNTSTDNIINPQQISIDENNVSNDRNFDKTSCDTSPINNTANEQKVSDETKSLDNTIAVITNIASKATDTTEFSSKKIKGIALVLMLVAVALSFGSYSEIVHKNVFGIVKWDETVTATIRPTTTSVLCALFLIVPAYIRSGATLTPYNILQNILNLLFASSLLSLFVGSEPWSIPFINISSQVILIFCILLSWIGMKSITGFIWIFIVILSIGRITDVDVAMGFHGVAFVLCGGFSFLFQSKDTEKNILLALKSDFYGHGRAIQADIENSIASVGIASGTATKLTGK